MVSESPGPPAFRSTCLRNFCSIELWGERRHPAFVSRYAEACHNEMEHVADILSGDVEPGTAYASSVGSLVHAEAAVLSAETGAPVRL